MSAQALLIVADTARGGLGAAAESEARWFSKRGWRVTLATPSEPESDHDFTRRRLDVPSRTGSPRVAEAIRQSRKLLHDVGPCIVHAHGTRSLLVLRLAGARPYLTIHGPPWATSSLQARVRSHLGFAAARLARAAFSVSPDRSAAGCVFMPHASPRLAWLGESEVPDLSPAVFTWIGALQPPKRPDVFVDAIVRASRARPMRGVIAGSGPLEHQLRERIRRSDAPIDLLPHTEDVATLYARSTATVLTSASEGVPFALQEAMWCGRPTIASDLPGTRWLAGDCGRLVDSTHGLIEALCSLSDRPRAIAAGRACAARIRTLLTIDTPWYGLERIFLAPDAPGTSPRTTAISMPTLAATESRE